MKKMLFSLAAIMILFAGCDGANLDIDDLDRDLSIYVRLLTSVEHGGWDNVDIDYQDVSSTGGVAADAAVGTVTITSPQDSYVRSDNVVITPIDGSTYTFAYWLFPSRTDEEIDDQSTKGNIRYDIENGSDVFPSVDFRDDGETVSLRTNNNPAELIGVFANDGNTFLGNIPAVTITCSTTGDTSVNYIIELSNDFGSAVIITDPQFRIFDEDGEAVDLWRDFGDTNDDGELVIANTGSEVWNDTLTAVDDRSGIDNWTVIVIFEDSAGDAYVVK